MKTYTFSIIYAGFLAVINFFHFRVEKWLIRATGKNFITYTLIALFVAFFLVVFLKKRARISNPEIAILLLTMGLVFFIFFSRPVVLFRLGVLEMFSLGVILAVESRKSKSLIPFLILAAASVLVEIASNLATGSSFFYLDAWRNALIALSGYLAGFLML